MFWQAGWSLCETEGYSIAYLDKEVVNYYFFVLAFAEALGGAATGKNDSFTEGIIYDDDNNITDNFPNKFVLSANIDG
mgnify:CR=1 FL=1